MGNAANCTRTDQYDVGVQMPSVTPTSLPPSSRESRNIPGPITPVLDDRYAPKTNLEQYSSVWDRESRLSPSFNQRLRAEFTRDDHHQKETMNNKWTQKSSANVDSTRVESTLNAQTHSCINLSTSERIDELIRNLNRIHTQLDDNIKRRTQQISNETESVLAQIINETQAEQQRLLTYAKEQQNKHDEHYRELLQGYIAQIDEMKAKDIANLQEELQAFREQIIQVSQMKIMTVNEQANIIKSKIVGEERQQASMKIETINSELQTLPNDETFQQFGSELLTNIHVTTSTNVGTKATGQKCTFEFTQEPPTKDKKNDVLSQNGPTRTSPTVVKSPTGLTRTSPTAVKSPTSLTRTSPTEVKSPTSPNNEQK